MGTASSVTEVTESDSEDRRTARKVAMNGPDERVKSPTSKTDKKENESNSKDGARKTNESGGGSEGPKVTTNEADRSKDAADESNKPKEPPPPQEPPPPLTREEIEVRKKSVFEGLENFIDTMKDKEWIDENGHYIEDARKLVYGFSISYFALKNAPLPDMIEFRKEVARFCLKTDVIDRLCGIVKDVYPRGWVSETTNKTEPNIWRPLSSSFLFLLNYSDASSEFAERVAGTPGFLEMIHRIIAESTDGHMKQEQSENSAKVGKWATSVAHNVSMVESNLPRLRSLNFTEVLKPYLQSPDQMRQLNSLATIAGIIDEKESEILNSQSDSVKFLLEVLEKGLTDPKRRHNGWSCKECALTVKLLARNDTNKKLLVELGVLKLLVELAKGSIEEQIEAVGAIWALSFDEENRKVMVEREELGVVTTLLNLKSSEEAKIKASANGALWNLRADLEKTKKFHELGEQLSNGRHKRELKKKASTQGGVVTEEAEQEEEEAGHIMISYQWGSQKTLMEVRNQLIANGFKVWMDIDQMGGSTLQAMADAVENASIVCVCMSQKYKDSPNCRAEAEYAFQQRKKIVPLMLERGYKPDGWLGFILGAKLFYDFSGKYSFQDKINDLLKELRRIKGQTKVSPKGQPKFSSNEPIVPEKAQPNYHQPQIMDIPDSAHPGSVVMTTHVNITDDVRKWTGDDVTNWINKCKLPVQKFGSLTADEIALLIAMKRDAPESFYRCLQDILKITDLVTMSKLVWALDDIGK